MTTVIDGTNGITTPLDVEIQGSVSGSVKLVVPSVAGTSTITLPAGTGTAAVQGVSTNIVSGTAQASTSGTSIDFTGIPSWAKRITVMFNGISTSGTSLIQVQLGSGSVQTSGYAGGAQSAGSGNNTNTTGILISASVAAATNFYGVMQICLVSGTTYAIGGTSATASPAGNNATAFGYSVSLAGTLDRVRITTVNGTDTFDAGSINILYE